MRWWREAARRALRQAIRGAARTARLMVGVPDYDAYVAHCRAHHPERPPMTRAAFHRDRIERRYGVGKGAPPRCC